MATDLEPPAMRRIKVVVSDFHMGFGRLAADGTVNDLEDFVSDQAFVDLLEYYRTGEYADAEVEVILAGDIFECLAGVGDDPQPDMITARKSVARVERIVSGHPEVFSALRVFAEGERRRVVFLVGNHDQDLLWEEVRELLTERVSKAVRFVDSPYRFDGVHLEHGHWHEPHNRVSPDKMFLTKGLPEPILNLPWGSDMFVNWLLRFKRLRPHVNRVQPLGIALFWSLFFDFRALMRGIWYFLVAIVKARFRRHRQRRITLLQTLRHMFAAGALPTLEDVARRVLRRKDVHTVVFGHTHIPMWRKLGPGKTYVNCGTWIPNTNLSLSALGLNLLQTYVHIEYLDGVPRARLKLWHGRRVVEEDIIL